MILYIIIYMCIYIYIYIWMPNIWTWESLQDFTFGHEFRFWISVTVSGLNIVLVTAGPPNKFKEKRRAMPKRDFSQDPKVSFLSNPTNSIKFSKFLHSIQKPSHVFVFFCVSSREKRTSKNAVLRHVGAARNLLKANPTGWLNRWPQKM